ncbi:MAG: DNA primase [Planctomycetaceae bacterium]|nr:DNA primase [Planctomycetaceae bacterium]
MSVEFPQDFREAVRAGTDIVGLIGEAVTLQPRSGGREYVGLCCFHEDHNPSMVVYPDRQTFRCWSCNTGGDIFTFVMEREKVEFRDALEILARRAEIPIPKKVSGRTEHEEHNRAKLFEVLQWADNMFHKCLVESPAAAPAREYLHSRGFNDDLIDEYRLGYHPNDWTWLIEQSKFKYPEKLLHEARLVGEKDGRYYDYFVDRVLFTIRNERGQPVAFGGRVLPGSTSNAKYFNSPESAVFHKSRLLYGIDKARDAIRDAGSVLVTEGYTDCLTCHQHGVKNVVATLGTALTDAHVTALKRFARKVVLVFDGDDAGQSAASRAVERFLAQDVDLRILTLPGKQDPAEYITFAGPEAMRQLIERAPEAWEFAFRTTQMKYGIDTIDGKHRVLEEMLALLAQIPQLAENVKEGLLLANLAQRLGVPEQRVRDRLKELRQGRRNQPHRSEEAVERPAMATEVDRLVRGRLSRDDRLECDLLEIILAVPAAFPYVRRTLSIGKEGGSLEPHEAAEVLRHPALRMLLQTCLEQANPGGALSFSKVLDALEDTSMKRLVVWLDERARSKDLAGRVETLGNDPVDDCPMLLRRSLNNLKWRGEEQSNQRVAMQLSQHGDGPQTLDPAMEALLRQAAEFHQRRATQRAES